MVSAIYLLRADANNYKNLIIPDKADRENFELVDGRSLKETWLPPKVEEDHEEGRGDLLNGDFPSLLRHAPAFSLRALVALEAILKNPGEVLPLNCKNCKGSPYFTYNVTSIVDVLDQEKSEVKYFSSGHVMRVIKYAFLYDRLGDLAIFKIPQLPKSEIFVTNSFISAVESTHLTGFQFEIVWTA